MYCMLYMNCSYSSTYVPVFSLRAGVFDSLDKAFCVLKLDSPEFASKSEVADDVQTTDLIRRVDLIVSPPDQYPFALVSWTGSKVCQLWFCLIIYQCDQRDYLEDVDDII